MKPPVRVDYIIVGQGLAGCAVAVQMLRRNLTLLVVDNVSGNASSRIAAGLFNPITGQNLVKTWKADVLFPYLRQFYSEVEVMTGHRFFHEMALYRPFGTIQEQNEWMGRSSDENYVPYLKSIHTQSQFQDELHDDLGGLMLNHTGYLNTAAYVQAVRGMITERNHFLEEEFVYDDLKIDRKGVSYRGFEAEKIIFCEGEKVFNNPWFKHLPVRPLKGETVTIKTSVQRHVILNRGVYMVPGNVPGEWKVGSTYNFNVRVPGTTETGRLELEEKLKELIKTSYEIVGQDWGIRPTTKDRRPIIGRHPEFQNLLIFNGLGTKGVSLAPYFSEVMVRWVVGTGTLNKEVDVARYN